MAKKAKPAFDLNAFLTTADGGRTVATYKKGGAVFAQAEPADAVFYIQKGKVKIAVTSDQGKEAIVAILGTGDFFGEGCLIGQPLRLAAATAMTDCTIMRMDKPTMVRVLHEEPMLADRFMAHLLTRNTRVEEDLGRSVVQFQREAARDQDQPGDAGRDGRDDLAARELFHEQVQKFRVHRIQRQPGSSSVIVERGPARLTTAKSRRLVNFEQPGLRPVVRLPHGGLSRRGA
jgi:CRP-like cAMP-binding protein